MCLLIALHRVHPDAPLIVAANRDELLARPAVAMTILQAEGPRILGGRDAVAGGTWLAVNEHGVVAGVTNRPFGPKDTAKRSRGEWPLFLARHADAASAVEAFSREFEPADFNPGWLLVGDGRDLYYLDMTSSPAPLPSRLDPGMHVLENVAFEAPSAKADHVRARLQGVASHRGRVLRSRLWQLLGSHELPPRSRRSSDGLPSRPRETEAACVHAGRYGTRSSTLIAVSSSGERPAVWSSDGPPCGSQPVEVTRLWRAPAAARDDGNDEIAFA